MFEQSILAGHPTNRGAGFLVSLGVQSAVVAIGILIPLFYTNNLPFVQLISPLTVPLAPRPPQVASSAQRSSVSAAPKPSQIFVPPRVPQTIAIINDEPAAIAAPPVEGGVPGGMGAPVPGDAINRLMSNSQPPPPVRQEAKEPARASQPVRVGGSVQEAKLVRKVMPIYPALARQARVSGTVQLIGIIGKDGVVQNLRLISGPPLLVNAALDAVRQWLYKPTLLNGEPVEVICPINVNFILN